MILFDPLSTGVVFFDKNRSFSQKMMIDRETEIDYDNEMPQIKIDRETEIKTGR
jgi:hypothetical protein